MLSKSSLEPNLPPKLDQVRLDLKDLFRYIREDPSTDSPRINCLERCLSSAGKLVSMATSIVDLRLKRRMKQEVEPPQSQPPSNKFSYTKPSANPNSSLYRSTSNEVLRPIADTFARPRGATLTRVASPSPISYRLPNFPTAPLQIDTSRNAIESRHHHNFPTPPDSASQFVPRGRSGTPVNRYAPPLDLPSPPMSDISPSPKSYAYPSNAPSPYSTRD